MPVLHPSITRASRVPTEVVVALSLGAILIIVLVMLAYWPKAGRPPDSPDPAIVAALKDWPAGWDKEITNGIGMKLAPIPKGTFWRGATKDIDAGASSDEWPRREIGISAFHLGVFEVTQKQFKQVMGYNPSYFSRDGTGRDAATRYDGRWPPAGGKHQVGKDTDDFPVENVTWEEAKEFCDKLSARAEEKREKRQYRLPTEAEWEYACRGGAKEYRKFNVGDRLSNLDANFDGSELSRTCKVGSYKPNAFGLYDMHGNVREWCGDWFASYRHSSDVVDPRGPVKREDFRVDRGGCWSGSSWFCRAACRRGVERSNPVGYLGFRVALVQFNPNP